MPWEDAKSKTGKVNIQNWVPEPKPPAEPWQEPIEDNSPEAVKRASNAVSAFTKTMFQLGEQNKTAESRFLADQEMLMKDHPNKWVAYSATMGLIDHARTYDALAKKCKRSGEVIENLLLVEVNAEAFDNMREQCADELPRSDNSAVEIRKRGHGKANIGPTKSPRG